MKKGSKRPERSDFAGADGNEQAVADAVLKLVKLQSEVIEAMAAAVMAMSDSQRNGDDDDDDEDDEEEEDNGEKEGG